MPVVRDLPIALDVEQVRSAARKRFRREPFVDDLLDEMLTVIRHEGLLQPAIAWEAYRIAELCRAGVRLENGVVLGGSLLASFLASMRELAVMVCTIGPRLEGKVSGYFAHDRPLHGLLLDDIGTAALLFLTHEACEQVNREASSRGCGLSDPFSPGTDGWPLPEQRLLFRLAPAREIGVSLTSSAMMSPRKSVSVGIGIGPGLSQDRPVEICFRCKMRSECGYSVACSV